MSISYVVIILLALPGAASVLSLVPGLLEEFHVLAWGFVNEIFSILIIPLYLAVMTVLLDNHTATSIWKGVFFIVAVLSVVIAVGIIYRSSASLVQAFTGDDPITRAVASVILLLAVIVYFVSYVIVDRIV